LRRGQVGGRVLQRKQVLPNTRAQSDTRGHRSTLLVTGRTGTHLQYVLYRRVQVPIGPIGLLKVWGNSFKDA
jgi:hypothetical protein